MGRSARRRTLAIIARERRSGALRSVLGAVRPTVIQLGRLNLGARRYGTTVLLGLPAARRRVRARVPAYLPDARGAAGFRLRRVTLSAPLLRDLLVDVDSARRRVMAVQPGPRSRTDGRQQSVGPTPRGLAFGLLARGAAAGAGLRARPGISEL